MSIANRQMLSMREAARVLAISETTLKGLVYAQRVPSMKVGNQWRFDPVLLERWVAEQSAGPR